MTKVSALAVFALLAACGSSPFEIELTIHLASDVDAQTESLITVLDFETTGGESFGKKLSLGRAIQQTELIIYRPMPTTRNLELEIGALDATGDVLASGSTSVTLNATGATKADLTLDRTGAMQDLSMSFDMATVDAPSAADAATEADMSSVCPTGALCYGFEPASPLPQGGSSACAVSTDHAYRGTQSMHCTGMTGSAFNASLPATTGPVGVRAHVWSTPPPGGTQSVGYIGLEHASANTEYAGDFGDTVFGFSYQQSSGTLVVESNVVDAPGWHCLEIVFTPPSSLSFYVDSGQVRSTVTDVDTGGTEQPSLVFGLPYIGSTSESYDVYFDDIAFGPGRLGCD